MVPATHAAVALSQHTPVGMIETLRLVTPTVSVTGVPKPQTPLEYCMNEADCAAESRISMLSVRAERSVAV